MHKMRMFHKIKMIGNYDLFTKSLKINSEFKHCEDCIEIACEIDCLAISNKYINIFYI